MIFTKDNFDPLTAFDLIESSVDKTHIYVTASYINTDGKEIKAGGKIPLVKECYDKELGIMEYDVIKPHQINLAIEKFKNFIIRHIQEYYSKI